MGALGAFTFVLHAHIPYARGKGRWPHGEEWIHEVAAETYLPLLNAFYDLQEEGSPTAVTLGITPVLAEQLADAGILTRFEGYLEDKRERAAADQRRFEGSGAARQAGLARFYEDWYSNALQSFRERFGRDFIGAFRRLQDSGAIEIITSAATHGYLPLLSRDSSIFGQVRTGVDSYRQRFGRPPRAIWLPECAYRPAYYAQADGREYLKPGIEEFVVENHLGCFFAETHTVEGGRPVGRTVEAIIGPYGGIRRRYVVPATAEAEGARRTTYKPYYVAGSEVAVIGRNNRTSMQVWSAENGYPGEFCYREFHKKDSESGLQYWRVTGAGVDLADKDWYDPAQAAERAQGHADHFARLVEDLLRERQAAGESFAIIASSYDAELFGHWWFEGIEWIKQVLRRLGRRETVEVTTASRYLEAHPPDEALALPEGSWGKGGTHWVWDNEDTHWMWPIIHAAERRMEALAAVDTNDAQRLAALNQAARELLLLQSSDWPFLVTTGQAREYAEGRFRSHVARFEELAAMAEGQIDPTAMAEIEATDNPFPSVDYRHFRNRERPTSA